MTRRRLVHWVRQAHLLLGVAFSLVLLVVAGSGAILVYGPELERALGPDVDWVPGDPTAAWTTVRDVAIEARPDHRLQMIWFPTVERPFFTSAYAIGDREYTDALTLHPTTAEPLSQAPPAWIGWVEELHENLHLGGVGGTLVAWSTPALVLLVISGAWIGWPRSGGLQAALRIRRGRNLLLDTHRSGGLLALPFLVAMAWTGAVLAFPSVLEPWVHRATGATPPATSRGEYWRLESDPARASEEGSAPGDANAQAMIDHALAASGPGAQVDFLSFPIHERENRLVRVHLAGSAGEKSAFYFDRYSGDLLAEDLPDPSPAGRYLQRFNAELHFGTIGGAPTRLLWVLACLVLVHLAWSGTWLWLRRRRRRRH